MKILTCVQFVASLDASLAFTESKRTLPVKIESAPLELAVRLQNFVLFVSSLYVGKSTNWLRLGAQSDTEILCLVMKIVKCNRFNYCNILDSAAIYLH
jgi:hypothetical protein